MTVSNTNPRNEYTAGPSQTVFVYTWGIPSDADIAVYLDGVRKTLTTHYTVTGAGSDAGGTVVFGVAPTTGAKVVLVRDCQFERLTDYQPSGAFRAEQINLELDQTVYRDQQLQEQLNRTLQIAPFAGLESENFSITETASERANKLIGFDGAGNLTTTQGIQPLDPTLIALAGVTTSANKLIYANGPDSFTTTDLTLFARGLLNDVDATEARQSLGVTATGADPAYLKVNSNLSDLSDKAAARANLDLEIGVDVSAPIGAFIGDSGSGGSAGLVPAPTTGDATKFLKGDGTWGTPAGGGGSSDWNDLTNVPAAIDAIDALTPAADQLVYFTGSSTAGLTPITTFTRSLIDDADAATARSTLGLGSIATQSSSSVSITGGSITGITDLAVADGGTGASTPSDARTNLGLGSIATQAASAVTITGGSISGIADLAIADGGTGASDATTARTNLGLVIGTDVQGFDPTLAALAGVTTSADKLIYATGSDTFSTTDLTSFGRSMAGAANAAAGTALLSGMVGDAGSGGTKGLVPAPAAGDAAGGKYLKADGTWAVPPGTGGGGAPTTATYVTLTTDGTLSNERTLAGESTVVSITDGGAGSTVTVGVAANGITNAKLRQSSALSVVGRSANSTGNVADIAAGSDGHVLRRSGTTLGFGQIAAGAIPNSLITNAMLANVSTATFKGRTTAGAGAPEDLTATQATALLNAVVGDSGSGGTKGLVPAPASGDAAASKFLKADGTWAVPAGGGGSFDISALTQESNDLDPFGDFLAMYDASASAHRKFNPSMFLAGGQRWSFLESDFFMKEPFSFWTDTGQEGSSNQSDANHPGAWNISSGSGASYAALALQNPFSWVLGSGRIIFRSWLRFPNLSTGTDRFQVAVGFHDNTFTLTPNAAVLIRYKDDVATGQWQLACRSGGTETAQTIAVTAAASTWYRLEIDINAAANSIVGYVNGTASSAITTNIPTSTQLHAVAAQIIKTNGSNQREVDVDRCEILKAFTSRR